VASTYHNQSYETVPKTASTTLDPRTMVGPADVKQCTDGTGDNNYSWEIFLPLEHNKTNTRQNDLLAKCVTKLVVHDE